MRTTNTSPKIAQMARMSLLMAIIILLTFTPLGYITIGPIAATTIQMPVIIGGILMGPSAGLMLGGIFGLSAVAKVLLMPGADIFATAILNYNFLLYCMIAILPRLIMGWMSGVLALGLKKVSYFNRGTNIARYAITGFVGSMLNTVLYLGFLWLFASEIVAELNQMDISRVGAFVMGIATTAGIPEALVSAFVVGSVCRALRTIDMAK